MAFSLYAATVPVFKQYLNGLDAILTKAEGHATVGKIEPDALLQGRLFPDMFTFVRQVQLSTSWAREITARLAGLEVPEYEKTEHSFGDLHALIAKTLAYLDGVSASAIEGQSEREIVLRPGTPREHHFTGQSYLLNYALPQFFFHVTTAYAVLRSSGVVIGKRDFLGQY
ncbi:MAG TPA: DUF1993 domain-containing protein [Castellaniella sp.]|uniref:DUF1993 domain-containing protein n=1 Tax=Castellaniella sp. TaxID=1955812 RepID=UPI002EFA82A3